MFIGRRNELNALENLRNKNTGSLVCILGRRRIGKSSLIEEFGMRFKSFLEIQALGPDQNADNQTQLDHFSTKLSIHFKTREERFNNWTEAFSAMAALTKNGEHLILLDEISWMGKKDAQFTARLKEVWDTQLKKNNKLMLVICGSVSSWIEENILKNSAFEGRISLEINLGELSLPEINQFWAKQKMRLSSIEKMLLLSVTGGVPKYLEEFIPSESIEKNLIRLCYRSSGLLFNDYEKIFVEIFSRKTKTYEKIVRRCIEKKLSQADLAVQLGIEQSGELSEHIHHLELSGFISRDYYYKADGTQSKLSHIRVKDNYLRFYLKNILPLKEKIRSKAKTIQSISDIKNFEAIMGFQFENLILANKPTLHSMVGIHENSIHSSAPYTQKKGTKHKASCQIDLLTHTNLDVFYLFEFKCKKRIDHSVVKEVEKKVNAITLPRRSAIKPILVYEGEIYPSHLEQIQAYFFKIVPFSDFFVNAT